MTLPIVERDKPVALASSARVSAGFTRNKPNTRSSFWRLRSFSEERVDSGPGVCKAVDHAVQARHPRWDPTKD